MDRRDWSGLGCLIALLLLPLVWVANAFAVAATTPTPYFPESFDNPNRAQRKDTIPVVAIIIFSIITFAFYTWVAMVGSRTLPPDVIESGAPAAVIMGAWMGTIGLGVLGWALVFGRKQTRRKKERQVQAQSQHRAQLSKC